MQTLDLKRIAETANLKASYLGAHLFPGNKDQAHAVRRVMRGEMLLNSEQIAKLSELLNVPIGLLFYDTKQWAADSDRVNIINFRAHNYHAQLNLATMETTLSRNGLVFFEKILTHDRGIGLTDYLSQLTDLIIKYK